MQVAPDLKGLLFWVLNRSRLLRTLLRVQSSSRRRSRKTSLRRYGGGQFRPSGTATLADVDARDIPGSSPGTRMTVSTISGIALGDAHGPAWRVGWARAARALLIES